MRGRCVLSWGKSKYKDFKVGKFLLFLRNKKVSVVGEEVSK